MKVTWHCRKCGAYFKGTWLTERCDCGNRRFLNAVDIHGGRVYSKDVIVPSGAGYVFDEHELRVVPTGDDTGV